MKHRSLVWPLLALALAGALPTTASGAAFELTEAGGARFPDRSYVLSLPSPIKLSSGSVVVTENGNPVTGTSLVPVEQAASRFGTVLVIDASNSMRGGPQLEALKAAKAFASHRKPNQQLGVVTFNKRATALLPLTSDGAAIDAALAKPAPLHFGTHIYDAVNEALALLRAKKVQAGSVVVLSDGSDTGSSLTLEQITSAARVAHVRLFTVGLRSSRFDPDTLRSLAIEGRGRYTEAASATQLGKIYNQLGSQIASEYLLRYRSLAGPSKQIEVHIRVDRIAGTAGAHYQTPKLNLSQGPAGPYHRSLGERLWTSPLAMGLVALLAAALVGLGAASAISGRSPAGTLRRRMAEFVSLPASGRRRRSTAQLTDRVFEGTGSLLEGRSWWTRFKWELEVAEVKVPAEQIVVMTLLGAFMTVWIVKAISGSLLVAVILAAAVPYTVRTLLKNKLNRRRAAFAEQLPDNLQVMASALRAGHSFVGALAVVVNDAAEPSRSEFQRVVGDEQLGVPLDRALEVVVERMANRELEQVALVATLQRETGGNTAEVLDRVIATVRERFQLRRTVQTLTAQGRMSRWVLTFLPVVLLLVITLINPAYMEIMYSTGAGRVLLVLAAMSVAAGSIVIKRIVNIKV